MIRINLYAFWGALVVLPSFSTAEEANAVSMSGGWNSTYVSEGRDNLDTGGQVWAEILATYGDWEFLLYRGEGDSTSYGEWNFGVAETVSMGALDLAVSYRYLYFTDEKSYDHELALELMVPGYAGFDTSIAMVYSTEADGFFGEIFVERRFALSEKLFVSPHGICGANGGYVVGEPEGLNHAQLGIVMSYYLRKDISLNLSAHQSFGIADGLKDVAWVGVYFDIGGALLMHNLFRPYRHD